MPEWLLKKDNYIPLEEKNTFINKSILTILKMLQNLNMSQNLNLIDLK